MDCDRMRMGENGGADRLLVFVHVPKTAGSTLNSIFAHWYSPEETYEVMMRGMSLVMRGRPVIPRPLISFSKRRRLRAALKSLKPVRLVRGHIDLSLAESLPENAYYITLLRDPVERAISHFYHYRRLISDPAHELATKSTVFEWVTQRGLVEMDNGQTRRLAGEMGIPVGELKPSALQKAKSNLAKRFSLVGLTERFEDFQILLHRQFSRPYMRYAACNVGNGRPRREELDADVVRGIEDHNQLDVELYGFAKELFESAISDIDVDRERSALDVAPQYVECTGKGLVSALSTFPAAAIASQTT